MNHVVLVTESQRTEQMMTMLIILLVVVALLLILATVWYWRRTDPRRYAPAQPQYRRVEAADSYGGYGDLRVGGGRGDAPYAQGRGRREPAPTGQVPTGHPGSDVWPPGNGRAPAGAPVRPQHDPRWNGPR